MKKATADAIVDLFSTINAKARKGEELAAALEKTKSSLPESAKSALTEFRKAKKKTK